MNIFSVIFSLLRFVLRRRNLNRMALMDPTETRTLTEAERWEIQIRPWKRFVVESEADNEAGGENVHQSRKQKQLRLRQRSAEQKAATQRASCRAQVCSGQKHSEEEEDEGHQPAAGSRAANQKTRKKTAAEKIRRWNRPKKIKSKRTKNLQLSHPNNSSDLHMTSTWPPYDLYPLIGHNQKIFLLKMNEE